MPLRRIIPSFTVEVRSRRWRPKSENASPSWVDLARAPIAPSDHPCQVAELELKSVAAEGSTEPTMPATRLGRILPSLYEPVPPENETGDASKKASRTQGAQRSRGAAKRWKSSIEGSHASPRETVATEQPLAIESPDDDGPVLRASETIMVAAPSSSTQLSLTSRRRARNENSASTSNQLGSATERRAGPDRCDAAESVSTAHLETAVLGSPARKRTILSRYVFRDEAKPGEKWKRRILKRLSVEP
jgi:hypothetical protein